jgi:ankyrin repeat protein
MIVQYGHVDVVEYLLEHASLPLDHRDSQGDTALIYAVQYVLFFFFSECDSNLIIRPVSPLSHDLFSNDLTSILFFFL